MERIYNHHQKIKLLNASKVILLSAALPLFPSSYPCDSKDKAKVGVRGRPRPSHESAIIDSPLVGGGQKDTSGRPFTGVS